MLSFVFDWMQKYGIESLISLAVIGGVYVLWVQFLKYYFDRLRNKNSEQDDTIIFTRRRKEDLKDQEFFSNIEFKLNVDIPSEEFPGNEARSALLRDLTKLLFSSYHEHMFKFINDIDTEWSRTEWAKNMNDVNYKAIDHFKAKSMENKIPPEALKRYLVWYTPYMQQIFFYIRKISSMENKNAIENTNTFLLLLELILINALSDVTKATSFNGELDDIEYNGKVIGEE